MLRITTTILMTLIMTNFLSAQSPYVPYGHYGLVGPGLRRDIAAAYQPSVVRSISDRHYDRGHSYSNRLVADRYLTNPTQGAYDRRSCGAIASYGNPGYRPSKRDRKTQRVLHDRDKYVKNNVYGDDTLFDRDQPLRNIFRYVFP